jgi:hypothetical protein
MTPAPTPGGAGNAYQGLFNATYYASKPSVFWSLFAGRPDTGRTDRWSNLAPLTQAQTWALVAQLIAAGWAVDEEIDAEGMDPYTTMFMRELYGNTWEPRGTGAVQVTDITQPGAVVTPGMYSGPVPAGQIKVSTMLEDYPPYPQAATGTPVAPPTPLSPNPVGIRIIPQVPAQANYVGDVFRCAVANDGYPTDGTGKWTGTSGAFSGTWTKESLEAGIMIVWVKTA